MIDIAELRRCGAARELARIFRGRTNRSSVADGRYPDSGSSAGVHTGRNFVPLRNNSGQQRGRHHLSTRQQKPYPRIWGSGARRLRRLRGAFRICRGWLVGIHINYQRGLRGRCVSRAGQYCASACARQMIVTVGSTRLSHWRAARTPSGDRPHRPRPPSPRPSSSAPPHHRGQPAHIDVVSSLILNITDHEVAAACNGLTTISARANRTPNTKPSTAALSPSSASVPTYLPAQPLRGRSPATRLFSE